MGIFWLNHKFSYPNHYSHPKLNLSVSGLQVKADKFFIFWLILTLVNVSAVSIAFFISAGVRNGEIANLLIILPFIFSLVSGTH